MGSSDGMKALSIRQPWAWLIAHGHKDVENRSWPTAHRGDTLIHASKIFDAGGLASVLLAFPHLRALLPAQYELGGIVGIVQVVGCADHSASPWFTGPYGFRLYGARPLPLVPTRGELGFFKVPMSAALHAALHSADPAQAEAAGQERLFR